MILCQGFLLGIHKNLRLCLLESRYVPFNGPPQTLRHVSLARLSGPGQLTATIRFHAPQPHRRSREP